MSFAPRNVCITGGAGFIGANFVRHWLDISREGRVVVLDSLTYAGNPENLAGLERNPRYVFVRGTESARGSSHRHAGALRGRIARRSLDSRA
jgi:dTDP-D-glucose 4,6-dehydratase